MAAPTPISLSRDPFASKLFPFSFNSCIELHNAAVKESGTFRLKLKAAKIEQTHLRKFPALRSNPGLALKASREPLGFTEHLENKELETMTTVEDGCDLFNDMKDRFLCFKKNKYMENIEQFQILASGQEPKFMVIACADSRVCPSNILGFQPGEAFVIRNVANLVPPFESGPSETNAALEFAVNTLKVENLMVIGHSCCGGIRALMSMEDDTDSGFIKSWVTHGNSAKVKTKATSGLSFDLQCRHCEKESINHSLLNLLTYPWIGEKVAKGELFIHGGYYDFVNCTFEKWALDYRKTKAEGSGKLAVKDTLFWS